MSRLVALNRSLARIVCSSLMQALYLTPGALASAISKFAYDRALLERAGTQAREAIRRNSEFGRMVRAFEGVYNGVLRRSGKG
jgi:hypothetical protein